MIPESWDDIAGAVALYVQGYKAVRKLWQERGNIWARCCQSGHATASLGGRMLGPVRRQWRAFTSIPIVWRVPLGIFLLNYMAYGAWDITAGSAPDWMTVYPSLAFAALLLCAAYYGMKRLGIRVKRLVWQI